MASDGLGPDGIEVDGVMPWPSDPMPYKRKCARVLAPIAFSVGKTFLKKFLGNGVLSVLSVKSVEIIDRIPTHFNTFNTLRVRRARLFLFEKQKPTEKPIGGLPL
jgi:hypothetical protein